MLNCGALPHTFPESRDHNQQQNHAHKRTYHHSDSLQLLSFPLLPVSHATGITPALPALNACVLALLSFHCLQVTTGTSHGKALRS